MFECLLTGRQMGWQHPGPATWLQSQVHHVLRALKLVAVSPPLDKGQWELARDGVSAVFPGAEDKRGAW